jgi:hypothetical protein
MVVGVLEAGLGFVAAGPPARTAGLVVMAVGGVGLLRGVADLVTGLRLREVRAARAEVLELTPERALGLTGYTAGMTDYESAPARSRARHRAPAKGSGRDWADPGPAGRSGRFTGSAAGGGTTADAVTGGVPAVGGMAAAGYVAADRTGPAAESFHQEVLRTTADLDAMLALAGVTGAGVGARTADYEAPEVPDTPEGAERPDDEPSAQEHADRTAGEARQAAGAEARSD